MDTRLNRKRGKRTERAIAKKLGGRRLGILGKHDVELDDFAVEVKSRKVFAGEKWIMQSEKNAPKGKVAIVVVHLLNRNHDNDIVMMRMKDFMKVIGGQDDK